MSTAQQEKTQEDLIAAQLHQINTKNKWVYDSIIPHPHDSDQMNLLLIALQPALDVAEQTRNAQQELKEAESFLSSEANDKEFAELAQEEIQACYDKLSVFQKDMTNTLISFEAAVIVYEDAVRASAKSTKVHDPRMRTDNVILEIRPGAGGEEAGLFARELLSSYQAYAKTQGWQWEVISMSVLGDKPGGALREAVVSVVGRNVSSILEYESGVHRVQRVPLTEKQGKVHTSTVGMVVMPVPTESALSDSSADAIYDMNDVKVEVMRASGAGGQHVNTTNSKVRVKHIPTGIEVVIQDQRSQHRNKAEALKLLGSKLLQQKQEKEKQEVQRTRNEQVSELGRNQRIRTYNFAQNRVTDHRRSAVTLHVLDQLMNGDAGAWDSVIDAVREELDREEEDEVVG